MRKHVVFVLCVLGFSSALAVPPTPGLQGDVTVPGYSKSDLLNQAKSVSKNADDFSVISYNYPQVVSQSRTYIQGLLDEISIQSTLTTKLNLIIQNVLNGPYGFVGPQGEGDWCSATTRGCLHVV